MALNYDSETGNDYESIYYGEDTVTGLIIIGGIYNDGPNSMKVKVTVDDLWGETGQFTEDTILANTLWRLNTLVDIGTAAYPFTTINVEVKSETTDLHTSYRARGLDVEN